MWDDGKNKNGICLALALIILAQLIYTTILFSEKQVFHSDEIWSYGLANSYYKPFIYGQDDIFIEKITPEQYTNNNQWISAEVFKDYITVQKGQQFDYKSVYHNQSLDHHPPLYYMLLHTVCSLFPDSFSIWYGYFLSAIDLILTQLFLFLLVQKVTGRSLTALMTCFLYGAGNGAAITFTFIRQYSLLTMFCVIYTYLGACLYEDYQEKKTARRHLLKAAVAAFCAFMTHYYAVIYIGGFTAALCLWLFYKKKWKKMLQFGCSMLAVLGAYILLYPAVLLQTFFGGAFKAASLPFTVQYCALLNFIFRYNLGFYIDPWKGIPWKAVGLAFLFLFLCAGIQCIPFRKKGWLLALWNKRKNAYSQLEAAVKRVNWFPIIVLNGICLQCLLVNMTVCMTSMGIYTMRYVFMDFPLACMFAVVFLEWGLKIVTLGKREKIARVCLIVITIFAVVLSKFISVPYFDAIQIGKPGEIAERFKDKNCVLIVKEPQDYWLTTNVSMYLYDANEVYLTWGKYFEEESTNITDKEADYVIVCSRNLKLSETERSMIMEFKKQRDERLKYDDCPKAETTKTDTETEKLYLNDRIRTLNGGCEYTLEDLLILNGWFYYVLKLE